MIVSVSFYTGTRQKHMGEGTVLNAKIFSGFFSEMEPDFIISTI